MAAARIGLIAATLLACSPATARQPEPFVLPIRTEAPIVPVQTPPVYRIAWAYMEVCSGLRTEDIDDWTFWVVQDATFRLAGKGDTLYVGLAVKAIRSIFIAEPSMQDPRTVQHEMLHALGAWDEGSPLFRVCGVQ